MEIYSIDTYIPLRIFKPVLEKRSLFRKKLYYEISDIESILVFFHGLDADYNKFFEMFGYDIDNHIILIPTCRTHDNVGGKFKIEYIVEDFKKVMEIAKQVSVDTGKNKIVLSGHSLGSYIAYYLATEYEDLERLVLLSVLTNPKSILEDIFQTNGIFGKKILEKIKNNSLSKVGKRIVKYVMKYITSGRFDIDEGNNVIDMLYELYNSTPLDKLDNSKIKYPVIFIHGDMDKSVKWQYSKNLYNKLIEDGKDCEFYLLKNHDHSLIDLSNGKIPQEYLRYLSRI